MYAKRELILIPHRPWVPQGAMGPTIYLAGNNRDLTDGAL